MAAEAMPSYYADTLLSHYPLISDQVDKDELRIILHELESVIQTHRRSAVVEFGCYVGTTSLFIKRMLDYLAEESKFHVYDSFAGLPEKSVKDDSPAGMQFKTGELAVSRKEFQRQFKKAGLRTPVIHKAWFSDVVPADVPDAISFAYLDGDYYESILDSLRLVWPKLTTGATIVVDDYSNEALPGAARAVDEWLAHHPAILRVQSSLAIITV